MISLDTIAGKAIPAPKPSVPRTYAEKSFLNQYVTLNNAYDSSCETCNNCGSGNCNSCCSGTDD